MSRYRFIGEHRTHWRVEEMCRTLEVSRSGYYAWYGRPPSARARETRRLDTRIRMLFTEHRQVAGSPKLTALLRQEGEHVSRAWVARRMQALGLRSKVRRKFRVTTNARHAYPLAPNRLQRCFQVPAPNQVWVSDITYVPTQDGWVYVAVFLDLYSRKVVGWAVSRSLHHSLVLRALDRAVLHRQPPRGLLIHSDRGVQYACQAFTTRLRQRGFHQSMSRKGNCWDNAVAESFFKTLKTELIYHHNFRNLTNVQHELFKYLEIYYNRKRVHATLHYRTPSDFEQQNLRHCASKTVHYLKAIPSNVLRLPRRYAPRNDSKSIPTYVN